MRTTIVFLLVLVGCAGDLAEAREWVDSTGKHRLNAELVAVRGDKVILESTTGKILTLPIARLSAADQEFLKQRSVAAPRAEKPEMAKPEPSVSPSPITTATSDLASAAQPNVLAQQAFSVLKKHCAGCHGENESEEGGFGFALDREKLVSAGYVLPKDPEQSPLIERLTSKESPMPPEGEPRPTAEERLTLSQWVRSGAPSVLPQSKTSFVSTEQMYAMVAADVKSVDRRDRPFIRYFTITHLKNAGVSSEELATYRLALAKLTNSLSWNRQLASLRAVDSRDDLFRIDLRDLKWSVDNWKQILSYYPHSLVFDSREAFNVRTATSCEVPVVRADWFVATASRPPLYHELAQIPTSDQRLEATLRVNAQQNIDQSRTIRAGFARSGVSQNNRLIERHESIFGAYWKSYDFAGNTGRKNLFENPVGPGTTSGTFEHDGGEIIFRLPNGMLGYMLTDQHGRRIDRGPIEIVSDPRQPDRTVVNGVSCMSCHYGGFIQKSDEIRNHVLANKSAYRKLDEILALYPEPATIDKWIKADTNDYLQALAKSEIGMKNPTRAGEPIVLISNRYQGEVDKTLAAAELGLQVATFEAELNKIADDDLKRTVGAFKIRGGVVKRQAFDQVFVSLATSLKLGSRAATSTTRPGNMAANRPGAAGNGVSPVADEALRSGIDALKRKDLVVAQDEFALALRSSNDPGFRGRVYEHQVMLFERGESVTPLVEAHKNLLDLCQSSGEIQQARVNLFNSLIRFIQKPSSWLWRTQKPQTVDWDFKFPTSVSTVIASAFGKQLQNSPNHEPALRIMQSYWHHIHDNPEKRMPILVKLYDLHKERGERIDGMSANDLIFLLPNFGDPKRGAEILNELATTFEFGPGAYVRLAESKAWIRANEKDKAIKALESAYKQSKRGRAYGYSSRLVEVGELYLELNEPEQAKTVMLEALRAEKNASQVRKIQNKIAEATAMLGSDPNADQANPVTKPMDRLLDPNLATRMEAEAREKQAASSPALAFHGFFQAAKKWIEANEPQRALSALKKAAKALRWDASAEHNHVQIAEVYQQLNQNQEAVDHLIEALKLAKYDHNITQYQTNVSVLMSDDESIEVNAKDTRLIDPNYKFRAMARKAESEQSYSPDSLARNLLKAVQQWSLAGDAKEVERVGKNAETAIKRVEFKPHSLHERSYQDLARAYQQVDLHEEAIRCFVAAIEYASRDDDAVKHHEQIKVICEENGLPLPKLDKASALKLDPLNRYRVKARESEKKANEEKSLSTKLYRWKDAVAAWLKAEEETLALKAADQYAGLLMKKSDANHHDFGRLADLYSDVGNQEREIQALQKAIGLASESSKRRYQDRIDLLK